MTHPPRPSWQGPRPLSYRSPPRPGASRPAPPILLLECVDGLVDPLASLLEWSLPAQLVQSLVELLSNLLGRPFLAPHQDTTSQQPEDDHADDELVQHASPVHHKRQRLGTPLGPLAASWAAQ